MIPVLTINRTAEGAIGANLIVKVGAADTGVLVAAAESDLLLGVSPNFDTASGEPCDINVMGIADVKLGGTVARGQLITADSAGKGVLSAPLAGDNSNILGKALASGVSGDIISVLITHGTIQAAD